MRKRKNGLPARVYPKHGAFYYVDHSNQWHRLCAIREGLPAMYRALAALTEKYSRTGMVPEAVAEWLADPRHKWTDKYRKDEEAIGKVIADAFQDFHCSEVAESDCAEFLEHWVAQGKARMHNRYKTALVQIFRKAALKGWRTGHNPAKEVPGMSTPGRHKRVTDAEIKLVKEAAMVGKDGLPTDSGPAICKMIDLALLTAQRIGDIIKMRWQDVTPDGLYVIQSKGKGKRRILIEWSPALKEAVDACAVGTDRIGFLLKKSDGFGYRYAGIRSAWVRACERAGIDHRAFHIHDMRGRAGVDKKNKDGKEATQQLLGHGSMAMTEHYIEDKEDVVVTPSR